MSKKYMVLGLLIVLAVAGGIVFATNRMDKPVSSVTQVQNDQPKQLSLKFSDVTSQYPSEPEACLATSDDPNLKLDAADQTGIVDAATTTIIDVPAGTNVDIHVKTYGKTNATGTSIYESTYGIYNFTAKKAKTNSNSDQESWVVTKLVACKK